MQYVVKSNESIYDVALNLYGSASYAVKLMLENTSITSLNMDISNLTINYDSLFKSTVKAPLIVSTAIISDTKNTYTIKNGVSTYDLAISYGYGIEGVVDLLVSLPQLVNLDNVAIQNNQILVTKRSTDVSDFLILQNIVLSTNIVTITTGDISGASFDDGFDDSFDNGN